MQAKEKPFGFSYTRRGVRESLLVFLFFTFLVDIIQTLTVFCIFVTDVLRAGLPKNKQPGLNYVDFGTHITHSRLVSIHTVCSKCAVSAGV